VVRGAGINDRGRSTASLKETPKGKIIRLGADVIDLPRVKRILKSVHPFELWCYAAVNEFRGG
jgi:hypothetical protein